MKSIVLFTSHFPYEGGEQFLELEISYLGEAFDEVIIIPATGAEFSRSIPKNAVLLDDIINLRRGYIKRFLTALRFIADCKELPTSLSSLKYMLIYSQHAMSTKKVAKKLLKRKNINDVLFYTYWFGGATIGLSLLKRQNENMRIVTRVHGGDLYEYRHGFRLFPVRAKTLRNLNMVYAISNDGKKHLEEKYAEAKSKVLVSRLGVNVPSSMSTSFAENGLLRIVSCSSIEPIKRVHLIADAVNNLQSRGFNLHWTHIGDGHLRTEIERRHSSLTEITSFTGKLANKDVLFLYREQKFDVFVNVSESEGIPVSIMEAMSFSIPVVATAVGAVPEIVDEKCGRLLSPDPSPTEIANLIIDVISIENRDKLREAAYEKCSSQFNSEINYRDFVNRISNL